MAEQIQQAWSLAAWEEHATHVIQLSDTLAVRVRDYDVVAHLTSKQDHNPLMAALQSSMKNSSGGQAIGQQLMQDPAALAATVEMLNDLMIKVIVEPPLLEAGNERGISVNQIRFDHKMTIFSDLMGGKAQLQQLSTFHEEPRGSMVVRPKGETIREAAQRDDEGPSFTPFSPAG